MHFKCPYKHSESLGWTEFELNWVIFLIIKETHDVLESIQLLIIFAFATRNWTKDSLAHKIYYEWVYCTQINQWVWSNEVTQN